MYRPLSSCCIGVDRRRNNNAHPARNISRPFAVTTAYLSSTTQHPSDHEQPKQQLDSPITIIPWLDELLARFDNNNEKNQSLLPLILDGWLKECANNRVSNFPLAAQNVVNQCRNSSLTTAFHPFNNDETNTTPNDVFDILLEMLILLAPPPATRHRRQKQTQMHLLVQTIQHELDPSSCTIAPPTFVPNSADEHDSTVTTTPRYGAWNAVLRAWARSNRIDAAERMVQLHARHQASSWWDDSSWYWLLTAVAQSAHPDYGPARAEEIVFAAANATTTTTTTTTTTASVATKHPDWLRAILLGWTMKFQEQPLRHATERALTLLQELISAARQLDEMSLVNGDDDTNNNNNNDNNVNDERRLLLQHEYAQSIRNSYSAIIHVLAKAGIVYKAEKTLLQQCRQHHESLKGQHAVVVPWPTKTSFHDVMAVLARVGEGKRAERLLRQMKRAGNEISSQPTLLHYNLVLDAWAMARRPDKAEALFFQMLGDTPQYIQEELKNRSHVEKDAAVDDSEDSSYPTTLEATTDESSEGPSTALATAGVLPDVVSLTTVLKAWARSDHRNAAERALNFWDACTQPPERAMIVPDPLSYAMLMSIWSESRRIDAGDLAHAIFDQWLAHYKRSGYNPVFRPTEKSYFTLLTAWAKSGHGDRAEEVIAMMDQHGIQVDLACFHTVMEGWRRSALTESPERAHEVVNEAERRYRAGHRQCQPDVRLMAELIEVWGKSGRFEAVATGKDIFHEVLNKYQFKNQQQESEELRPLYNALLFLMTRTGLVGEAEELLLRMCDGQERTTPDIKSFNRVLAGLARSDLPDAPEKAERWLRKCQMYFRDHPPNVIDSAGPDTMSYNLTIKAWAHSTSVQSRELLVQKAEMLLQEMKDTSKAGVHASSSNSRLAASRIVPNHATYSYYLAAIVRAKLPNVKERVEQVIQDMREQGLHIPHQVNSLLERPPWNPNRFARRNEEEGAVVAALKDQSE
jgi:pentatricopeptide repeat protein